MYFVYKAQLAHSLRSFRCKYRKASLLFGIVPSNKESLSQVNSLPKNLKSSVVLSASIALLSACGEQGAGIIPSDIEIDSYENQAPVVVVDHRTEENVVYLDATGSFDPERSPMSYEWSVNGVVYATTANPVFELTQGHTYVFHLSVSDGSALTEVVYSVNLDGTPTPSPSVTPTPISNPTPTPTPTEEPQPIEPVGDAANGKVLYDGAYGCALCHGPTGQATAFKAIDPSREFYVHSSTGSVEYTLSDYNNLFMPVGGEGSCDMDCSNDLAAYIRSWNE